MTRARKACVAVGLAELARPPARWYEAWSPAVEDQATDRAHRIGQQRPITVVRFLAQGTIEEAVVALHAEKRKLAESILEGAGASGKLSVVVR